MRENNVDHQIKDLMMYTLLTGHLRETRSGNVTSTFGKTLQFDLTQGFPAVTSKTLFIKKVVGELLWFLSGNTDLDSLCDYSCMERGKWTIWTDDAERWGGKGNKNCGKIYGHNWRNFGGDHGGSNGVDQIVDLVIKLCTSTYGRYHRVTAYNPTDMSLDELALPACHTDFQCYVTGEGRLDLHWNQRSCDQFLGLPYNITSYAILTHILAHLCELKVGKLSCWIGDAHIYENHMDAARKFIDNDSYGPPTLKMPKFVNISQLLECNANDFSLIDYQSAGIIKAPLSVGV
jgi:thymidylate synthase